jgi:hypothetical protein
MFGRTLEIALCCWACAVLVACSSGPGGASDTTRRDVPVASALADAGSASPAGCELMTCPTSTPARVEGCTRVETLRAAHLAERTVLETSGTTRGASDSSQSEFGSCAGATSGPDVWYQLDLRNATGPLAMQAVVDASFDAVVDLRRGPCGDTRSIACDRAAVVGRVSSALAARLEPDVYWLVIDGGNPASAGDFRLQVELDPLVGCASPPSNQSCETAARLEPLERQTVLLDEACASNAGSDAGLYYELDLSAEAGPVLTRLSLWNLSQPHFESVNVYALTADAPYCETRLLNGYLNNGSAQRSSVDAQLLLSPGRYVIEVHPNEILPGTQLAFTLQVDREACREGPVANDCADAIDIDPAAASQVIEGSTVCNANRRTLPCALEGDEEAPEQFQRLDLRAAPGVTRARLTVLVDGLSFEPLLSLFSGTATGECGDALDCDDRVLDFEGPPHLSLLLEPGLYFVGIDGSNPGASGTYRLLVELEPAEPSPCVNAQIDACMDEGYTTIACCGEWSPLCNQLVALCGLSPATQACVCATNPACCESRLLPIDCSDAELACNYLCPDFIPSRYGCLGGQR